MRWIGVLAMCGILMGCQTKQNERPLFEDVAVSAGIQFRNDLSYTEEFNPYTFRNFFNGAGVAIGDINNDHLLDVYFTGNQVDNRLFLNTGNFKFVDITEKAGVACKNVWSTGVTMADVNSDGLLDIYVCKSGSPSGENRHNELFINNGDSTFTERSKEFGLDFVGLAVQAAFFDYDRDGDLDCYLLTNSFKSVGNFDLQKDQRLIPDEAGGGNKFLKNENGKFVDYTEKANVYQSSIGFGLGITLGDFNEDGWTDVFVSNDFFERDYLYINNQHGSFKESLTEYFESISMGSMGADFADLDNDGVAELFVTEMLPDSLHRRKTKTVFEGWNRYELNVEGGYYHQFSRNVLQKKIGKNRYAEIGRFAGVAASEWSWGALLFDMDNDGRRDIFVANGITKDLLDRDYLTYSGAEENVRKIIKEEERAILKLIDLMPSSSFSNYAFQNQDNLHFANRANEWGLSKPMFSNGSAFGDLDNDGDLDLVVNNINGPSAVYRNNTDTSVNKSISFALSGRDGNTFAVGSFVTVYAGSERYTSDNFVTRGFQSAVQHKVHIGLGSKTSKIDSVVVKWPDQTTSIFSNCKPNQAYHFHQPETASPEQQSEFDRGHLLQLKLITSNLFKHQGSDANDFNRDRLLPFMYCNEMPAISVGDIDQDKVLEFYVGGGKDQAGGLFKIDGDMIIPMNLTGLSQSVLGEETDGKLFDADGDGDLDFYRATGGRFFPNVSSAQQDKLYLNDGKGVFSESDQSLPFIATSTVETLDIERDGDLDLFIGERFDPFFYGSKTGGRVLINNGKGFFTDQTPEVAPELVNLGMVTDAVVVDYNLDGWKDIVLVGDWMPVTLLENRNGKLNVSTTTEFSKTTGWWNTVETNDLNQDGKPDFVFGNHGENSFFKAGDRMYVHDFDGNGSIEQIFCTKVGDMYFPIADRDELLSQIPSLKKTLLYYRDYASKSIDELFAGNILQKAEVFEVNTLSSKLALSGTGGYSMQDLPLEAQFSSIYSMVLDDVDGDQVPDLIAGGNQYLVKPQFGRMDASHGWFFKGRFADGKFSFDRGQSLNIKGQLRDIELIESRDNKYILIAKYDDQVEVYKVIR